MIHSSWSLVSHPPTPSQLPSYIMLRFHLQFDSHNSIYRRSRTTCDSSCSSSGESAKLRLPLSIINDDALQPHAAERPQGRAVLYLFSIEHAEQRWGGGSPGPLSVCVRASSHTLVGGHHHEETDHRVHAFATKPSGH